MERDILVVDDSATLRASLKFSLTGAGYRVTEAVNGKDAIDKLSALANNGTRVLLIITDINMPQMDGITFIKEVKKMADFKFIPILILTTESQESKKMEGKDAGAAGWLVKPFSDEQLIGVIRKFIR